MQKTSFFPPFIRTLSVLFIGTLLALVLARGAMLGILWPEVAGNPASDILNALMVVPNAIIMWILVGPLVKDMDAFQQIKHSEKNAAK